MSDIDANSQDARRDGAFALSMIVVAGITMWGLRNQPKAPYDPVGAAAIPFWTAAIVMALGLLLGARILMKRATRGDAISMFTMSESVDDSYSVRPRLSAYATAFSFFYTAAIPVCGFLLASLGFMLAFGWVLSDRTPRALVIVAVTAVACAVGLDQSFRALLIDLP